MQQVALHNGEPAAVQQREDRYKACSKAQKARRNSRLPQGAAGFRWVMLFTFVLWKVEGSPEGSERRLQLLNSTSTALYVVCRGVMTKHRKYCTIYTRALGGLSISASLDSDTPADKVAAAMLYDELVCVYEQQEAGAFNFDPVLYLNDGMGKHLEALYHTAVAAAGSFYPAPPHNDFEALKAHITACAVEGLYTPDDTWPAASDKLLLPTPRVPQALANAADKATANAAAAAAGTASERPSRKKIKTKIVDM